jgi:hypothetical protein
MAHCQDQLTRSASPKFFCRNSKDSEHLYHDFYDHVHHSRCRRDSDIRLEPLKEAFDTVKDVNNCILASANGFSCLWY